MTYYLADEKATIDIGKKIAKVANVGDIFLLTGDLGAGKTTFSKGFAQGLGISQMIKSPTYTLIKEYETGSIPLYHMDVYRVGDDASDLGIDDYLDGDGVCLIEWGSLIKNELDWPYIEIFLNKKSDGARSLKIEHENAEKLYQQILELLDDEESNSHE